VPRHHRGADPPGHHRHEAKGIELEEEGEPHGEAEHRHAPERAPLGALGAPGDERGAQRGPSGHEGGAEHDPARHAGRDGGPHHAPGRHPPVAEDEDPVEEDVGEVSHHHAHQDGHRAVHRLPGGARHGKAEERQESRDAPEGEARRVGPHVGWLVEDADEPRAEHEGARHDHGDDPREDDAALHPARHRSVVARPECLRHDGVHRGEHAEADRAHEPEGEVAEGGRGQRRAAHAPEHEGVHHPHEHEPHVHEHEREREARHLGDLGARGDQRAARGGDGITPTRSWRAAWSSRRTPPG
jgi:hypothetical protein